MSEPLNNQGLRAFVGGVSSDSETAREVFANAPSLILTGLVTGVVAGFSIAIGSALAQRFILKGRR
jgi:hypothetical protein